MAVKKSDVIKSLLNTTKEKITQILTTNESYENAHFPVFRDVLLASPDGECFKTNPDIKYIIVKLDPWIEEEAGKVPAMYISDMKFYDENDTEMNAETIDFHIIDDYYDEDDVPHVDDADDIRVTGINAHFQVTPIRSHDFKDELLMLSPVFLSVGGPIYSAISESIMHAIELLNLNPNDDTTVVLELVLPDLPYMHGNEPNRLAKDIVALAESLAYKFLDLQDHGLDIHTSVIWIRNVNTCASINSYVNKKGKKKNKKKSK